MHGLRIAGAVLAGGRGSRLDGRDKGLLEIAAQPMIAYVIERFRPQVDTLMINANRNLARYREFGFPVVCDAFADYPGPLAGIGAALANANAPFVACVPCDSPFLPDDLVMRLAGAIGPADVSYALSGGQAQPVFALLRASLLESLTDYVNGGGRKIMAWYRELNHVAVDFGESTEQFANVNTAADLADAATSVSAT